MIRCFASALAAFALLTSSLAKAADQNPSFTVPVSIVDGYVIVDVRVNGQGPFHFMFDTGAAIVVLDPVVQKLGVDARDWGDSVGDGERKVRWRRADISDLQLGPLHLRDRVVGVMPVDDIRADFGTFPLSGFIGTPLLKEMAVKLDYVHRQLTFTPADQFSYSGTGTVLTFNDRHIALNIDGLEQSLFVDTGTKPGLTLGAATSAANGLPSKYGASIQGIMDWGEGGAVRTQLVRGHVVALGDIQVRDPLLYLSVQKAGILASAGGAVGSGLLSRFDVVFDTARSRMILEKNSNFDNPEPYDLLGMWMIQDGDHFAVDDVIAGGPADKAGVKTGDTIVEIDGTPTTSLVLPFVREQWEQRHAGEQVKLLLQSGNTQRTAVITLQDRV